MKIYYMEQKSDEWFKVKLMHFTASHANTIRANGAGLKTLCKKMVTEYYSSGENESYVNAYTNAHIERGNSWEDIARQVYQLETGNKVEQVGFVELDEHTGCSPDGLVNDDGLLEIKNLSDGVFVDLALTGKISKEHYDQMQMQLYVTGRKWCDYFVFNPNFSPNYILFKVNPDKDAINEIKQGITNGKVILKRFDEALGKQFNLPERTAA